MPSPRRALMAKLPEAKSLATRIDSREGAVACDSEMYERKKWWQRTADFEEGREATGRYEKKRQRKEEEGFANSQCRQWPCTRETKRRRWQTIKFHRTTDRTNPRRRSRWTSAGAGRTRRVGLRQSERKMTATGGRP